MAGEADRNLDSVNTRVAELSTGKRTLMERLLQARQKGKMTAISRRRVSQTAPLSYAQRRMWFLDQLYPESPALNCDFAIRVHVPYNPTVLEKVLTEIVRRHEILRTVFRQVDGEVMQIIEPARPITVPIEDLSRLTPGEREEEALRLSTVEARKPFDLSEGPLLRVKMLRLAPDDCFLLITLHHIVADYSSMLVFSQELSALYVVYSAGLPSALPELPFQYADFAIWQNEQFHSGLLDRQLQYWRYQLKDLPRLRLPTDRPHITSATWEGAKYAIKLPAAVLATLREEGRRRGCTPFIVLLAAFKILLFRYSGQTDIPIGVPIANRTQAGTEKLIGFFVNSLVVRNQLDSTMTFEDLLERVRATAHSAFTNQDLPFERLVEELHPERDPALHPLFQVTFQSVPVPEGSTSLTRVGIERGTATIDLAVEVEEHPRDPVLRFEYSTVLFDAETIARMARHFQTLLESLTVSFTQRIVDLPLLTGSESRRLLVEWSGATESKSSESCLDMLIAEQAARNPEAEAVVFRGRRLSYRELDERANYLAHRLHQCGLETDSRIGVCFERSPELIVALLAVLKAGAAFVPIDPAYPLARRLWLAQDAGLDVVVAPVESNCDSTLGIPMVMIDDTGTAPYPPLVEILPQHLAYLIYTSGSTGLPKGVMVEHRAIVNQLCWMQRMFPLGPDDAVLQKYSISFDAALWEIFGPLMAGARLVLAEPGRQSDPEYLVDLMAREGVTVLDSVPSLVELLLEAGMQQKCPRLRMITCGGEVMPRHLLARLRTWPGLQVNNMYGPTEATITAVWWTDTAPHDIGASVPIGRPAAGARLYVLDQEGNLAPIGVPGELHIGGPGLARGYWNRPDLTKERFIADPFSETPGGRLFRTGDEVRYLPDGNLEFLGRLDQQIKVRGFRVEPGEIEAAILQHPGVAQCVVSVQGTESAATLIAYIVCRNRKNIEWWPSVGEYFIYDELLYHVMTQDEGRTSAYRQAIARAVGGKTVVDIGSGADLVLARQCVEAGARLVYAIEMIDSAYEAARSLIGRHGLQDKIVLLKGSSLDLDLPERVDVCVSELIGTIGSSEGVIPILNDARRFLKEGGVMIPRRCVTRVAAVSLPGNAVQHPEMTEVPRHYLEKVFEVVGHPFDVRVCVKHVERSSIVSDVGLFEELDFSGLIAPDASRSIRLRVTRDCRLDGLLLWLNLVPAEGIEIDVLAREHSWLPVFLPVVSPGLDVRAGDLIEVVCQRVASSSSWCPDYVVEGVIRRSSGNVVDFCHRSHRMGEAVGQNQFYKSLLATIAKQPESEGGYPSVSHTLEQSWSPTSTPSSLDSRDVVASLRTTLRSQLPEYMIPSSFVLVDDIPITMGGKVDRTTLSKLAASASSTRRHFIAPRTDLERTIAAVWCTVLNVDAVSLHDNFFDLGGHSLLLVKLLAQLRKADLGEVSLLQLFQYPTVAALAEHLEQQHIGASIKL